MALSLDALLCQFAYALRIIHLVRVVIPLALRATKDPNMPDSRTLWTAVVIICIAVSVFFSIN